MKDYHEKLEERYIIPEFEKRKILADLTSVLQSSMTLGAD